MEKVKFHLHPLSDLPYSLSCLIRFCLRENKIQETRDLRLREKFYRRNLGVGRLGVQGEYKGGKWEEKRRHWGGLATVFCMGG